MHWRPAFARNFERCRSSVRSSSSDGRGGPVSATKRDSYPLHKRKVHAGGDDLRSARTHPAQSKKPIGLKIKTSSTRRTIARPSAASSQGRISRLHVVLESDRRARQRPTETSTALIISRLPIVVINNIIPASPPARCPSSLPE